ncbi:MAG: hypothetical protein ABL879_03580 [Devosia sp.]
MRHLLALALALTFNAVSADAAVAPRVMLPPAQYDIEPAKGSFTVYWAQDVWELQLLCHNNTELACTDTKLREVYMLAAYKGTNVGKKLWLHERAHLAGWPHDHPGAHR